MSEDASVGATSHTPGEGHVTYVPEEQRFRMTVDGKPVYISTLEAVMFVLQQRYIAMSDVTAEKTREMQEQVNTIKEANRWLNAVTEAAVTGEFVAPPVQDDQPEPTGSYSGSGSTPESGVPVGGGSASESDTEALFAWMESNGLDTAGYEDPPTIQDFKHAQTQISNYVDQLSSNNDLRMLSLKAAVNKAQQAMTAADGVLQNIKQLMQTITSNMAR